MRIIAERLVGNDGPYARAFENLILVLIAVSVLSVILETTTTLPPLGIKLLWIGEIVIVAVFSFEYLLRLIAAPRKLAGC